MSAAEVDPPDRSSSWNSLSFTDVGHKLQPNQLNQLNQLNSRLLLSTATISAATGAGRAVLNDVLKVLVIVNHLGQQTCVVEPVGIMLFFIQVTGKSGKDGII